MKNGAEKGGTKRRKVQEASKIRTSPQDDVMFDLPLQQSKDFDRSTEYVSSGSKKESDQPKANTSREDERVVEEEDEDEELVDVYDPITWDDMVDDFLHSYVDEYEAEIPVQTHTRKFAIPSEPINDIRKVPPGWSPLDKGMDTR